MGRLEKLARQVGLRRFPDIGNLGEVGTGRLGKPVHGRRHRQGAKESDLAANW